MRSSLLQPREKFLVLEISPRESSGLFMSVDEDRNLVFEKIVAGAQLKKLLRSPVQSVSQKSWEGKHLFKSRRKVIAAADSSLATTIPVPLDLRRENAEKKETVTLPELENLIAQAMAKIFNQCRSEASRRLRIEELDTILVGAQVRRIKLDGKTVEDPVGRAGAKVSLLLELTFTGRGIFEELKQFFNAPDEFFFRESSQTRLTAFSRVRPLPLNLVVAEKDGTSLFIFEKTRDDHPVLYREKLDWNFGSLIRAISTALGVTESVAEDLYEAYTGGAMSEGAARYFHKATEPGVRQFLDGLSRAKLKGRIYVDTPYALPFALPYRENGTVFEKMPMEEIADELGFILQSNVPPHIASRYLAPFFEAYFDKHYGEINKKLRRRLHWLAE